MRGWIGLLMEGRPRNEHSSSAEEHFISSNQAHLTSCRKRKRKDAREKAICATITKETLHRYIQHSTHGRQSRLGQHASRPVLSTSLPFQDALARLPSS